MNTIKLGVMSLTLATIVAVGSGCYTRTTVREPAGAAVYPPGVYRQDNYYYSHDHDYRYDRDYRPSGYYDSRGFWHPYYYRR